jgi:lipoate---protein ligase
MHGDFKTPGGKLVRVDFDLDGGRFRNVVVSGDFFLYPEEVIDDIRGALEGASADLTETDIAIMVAGAMPVGAEWLGSSPAALATAVRRALTETEDGQDQ